MSGVKSPVRAGRSALATQGDKKLGLGDKKSSPADSKRGAKVVEDKSKIISSAKSNFLNSTNQKTKKSPLKRPSTPSPEKTKHLKEHLLSPASLKKAGLCSPPKKKPKLWKSKWQLATLSGEVTGTGKRKKASEASRLLDDEGVIHMLNRVPNVYGEVGKVGGVSGSSRLARARTAANKAIKASNNQNMSQKQKQQTKKEKAALKEDKGSMKQEKLTVDVGNHDNSGLVSPKTSPVFVKIDESPSQIQDVSDGSIVVSPRRASRHASGSGRGFSHLQHVTSLVKQEHNSSIIQSEDCFSYLRELPADLLDSVTNCDIRYSLPSQGLPSDPRQETSKSVAAKSNPAADSGNSTNTQTKAATRKPSVPSTSSADSGHRIMSPNQIKLEPGEGQSGNYSRSSVAHHQRLVQNAGERRLDEVRQILQTDSTRNNLMPSPVKAPGAFSEIYVRLYENFAQVTFSPGKSKLTSSLGPAAIDEMIQLLNFISSTRMYHAVLLTGLGNMFCQGIDLFHLCNTHPDRRKQLATEMANAVERLILALVKFSKMVVAAVNGETVGLGLAILPLCDMVFASDKASFRSYSTRLGHIAEGGLSISLRRQTSPFLRELILLGREMTAEELEKSGLVSQVFLAGRLMEETIPRVRKCCQMNSVGIQANKLLLNCALREEMERELPGETRLLTEIWATKEFNKNLVNFISSSPSIKLKKISS